MKHGISIKNVPMRTTVLCIGHLVSRRRDFDCAAYCVRTPRSSRAKWSLLDSVSGTSPQLGEKISAFLPHSAGQPDTGECHRRQYRGTVPARFCSRRRHQEQRAKTRPRMRSFCGAVQQGSRQRTGLLPPSRVVRRLCGTFFMPYTRVLPPRLHG